jgi:hypothetical protein
MKSSFDFSPMASRVNCAAATRSTVVVNVSK